MHPRPVADLGLAAAGQLPTAVRGPLRSAGGRRAVAQRHPAGGSPPARAERSARCLIVAWLGELLGWRPLRSVGDLRRRAAVRLRPSRRRQPRGVRHSERRRLRSERHPGHRAGERARRVRRQPRGDRSGSPAAADRPRPGGQAGRLLRRRHLRGGARPARPRSALRPLPRIRRAPLGARSAQRRQPAIGTFRHARIRRRFRGVTTTTVTSARRSALLSALLLAICAGWRLRPGSIEASAGFRPSRRPGICRSTSRSPAWGRTCWRPRWGTPIPPAPGPGRRFCSTWTADRPTGAVPADVRPYRHCHQRIAVRHHRGRRRGQARLDRRRDPRAAGRRSRARGVVASVADYSAILGADVLVLRGWRLDLDAGTLSLGADPWPAAPESSTFLSGGFAITRSPISASPAKRCRSCSTPVRRSQSSTSSCCDASACPSARSSRAGRWAARATPRASRPRSRVRSRSAQRISASAGSSPIRAVSPSGAACWGTTSSTRIRSR